MPGSLDGELGSPPVYSATPRGPRAVFYEVWRSSPEPLSLPHDLLLYCYGSCDAILRRISSLRSDYYRVVRLWGGSSPSRFHVDRLLVLPAKRVSLAMVLLFRTARDLFE